MLLALLDESVARVSALPPCPSACGVASWPPVQQTRTVRKLARPRAVLALESLRIGLLAEVAARIEYDIDPGGALDRDDPAQDDRPSRVGWAGASASRHSIVRVGGDPAAVPDQAPRLVVAAPHAAVLVG